MENKEIIGRLKLIAGLSELHGVNEFKVRALNNAIFNLERSSARLSTCTREQLEGLEKVGKSIAASLDEINRTGTCQQLIELQQKTPEGLMEILELPGLGAKKIRVLWEELEVDSVQKLREVLLDGSIARVKGFGDKTRKNILASLDYYQSQQFKVLYPLGKEMGDTLLGILHHALPDVRMELSGQLRRQLPVIDEILILMETSGYDVEGILGTIEWLSVDEQRSSPTTVRAIANPSGIAVTVKLVRSTVFALNWFKTSGDPEYISSLLDRLSEDARIQTEEDLYRLTGLSFVSPEVREAGDIPEDLIDHGDIRGIVHAHSTYSDGRQNLREMVLACREQGYEYLGITDHSKSSFFYANGLYENRVRQQQEEIDALNREFGDFRIFKGIECDILNDGSLDYAAEILETFDFVIISIHSVMNMDRQSATDRLVRAISNPYTTILGHMTGRLLLKREGYPIDLPAILDACAAHQVSIELNANPRRLDIDWTLIPQVLERGISISINPDAHSVAGFTDVAYGVNMARKAHVRRGENLTSLTKSELEAYFSNRKQAILSNA